MLKYKTGDLFDPANNFNVIVHGCNCFHTMKSGVAKIIAEKYPEAVEADKTLTEYGDRGKLGTIVVAAHKLGDDLFLIVNAYTQYSYGRDKQHLDYGALRSCMKMINSNFVSSDYRVGMPLIGGGLAGGDHQEIKKILNETLTDIDITVVELGT